jgi:hypothetical protein
MSNFTHIYADSDVGYDNLRKLKSDRIKIYRDLEEFENLQVDKKFAIFHIFYPFLDQEQFRNRVTKLVIMCEHVVILVSELHKDTVQFCRQHPHPKITYFLCGAMENFSSKYWMDWFLSSTYFYKNYKTQLLDQLNPYAVKPKMFDILLGHYREHRTQIYNYINANNLNDQVLMTYINYQQKISADGNSSTWFWEDEGLEVIDTDLKWTVSQVRYYGYKISLSQVVPIKAYNQTAYSVVAETNFADDFVFHTEKIVKPIIARRLFIVFGGYQYLKNLHQLGFKTFSDIIDESYDDEPDYKLRGDKICQQISYLLKQDQQQIINAIKPTVEHNYRVLMETDWNGDFARELRAVLLDHTN